MNRETETVYAMAYRGRGLLRQYQDRLGVLVVFDRGRNLFFRIPHASGRILWERLRQPATLLQLRERLSQAYPMVPLPVIEFDSEGFLEVLLDKGLVEPLDPSAS